MSENYRLRAGHHPASAMTKAYAVENFPVFDDMGMIQWMMSSPSGWLNQFDAYTNGGMSGLVRAIGKYNGPVFIAFATPMMIEYVVSTIFPTDGINEPLTLVYYSVVKSALQCIQAQGHLRIGNPIQAAEIQAGSGAVRQLRIDLDEGEIAPSGGEFTSEFTSEFVHGGIPD